MIYDCNYSRLGYWGEGNLFNNGYGVLVGVDGKSDFTVAEAYAAFIKESKDDSFVFAVNTGFNEEKFVAWLRKYDLEKLVVHKTDYGITNEAHPNRGIKLWILMSEKHWYRDLAKDDPEITEENFINYVNWPEDEND